MINFLQSLPPDEIATLVICIVIGVFIMLKNLGLLKLFTNGNGKHKEPCEFDQKVCDERHDRLDKNQEETINLVRSHQENTMKLINEQIITQRLLIQQMEQVDKRLDEGSKNFSEIQNGFNALDKRLDLLQQRVDIVLNRKNIGV